MCGGVAVGNDGRVAAPTDPRAILGRRLRALRRLRGATQEALAERAGLSAKFVGLIERGAANPSLDALARLALALGLDLWQFLRFEESRAKGPPARAAAVTAAAERVSQHLAGRPQAEIDRAVRLIEVALGPPRRKSR